MQETACEVPECGQKRTGFSILIRQNRVFLFLKIKPGMSKVENSYSVTAQSKLPGGSNGNRSSVPHVLFNNAWTDELNIGIVEYEHC